MNPEQKKIRDEFVYELRKNSVYQSGRDFLKILNTVKLILWTSLVTISIPGIFISMALMAVSSNPSFVSRQDLILATSLILFVISVVVRFCFDFFVFVGEAIFDALDIMWDQNTGI